MIACRSMAVALGLCTVALGADERSAAVDGLFSRYNPGPGHPGCAVAVIQDERVVYTHAYGLANLELDVPLTTSSVFAIASTTKQFTGFAVQLLRSRGKLALDESIRKYIPELPADFGEITLSHLLHHTSGIPQTSALAFLGAQRALVPPPQDLFQMLSRLRNLNFKVGSEYGYSNEDYTLLGVVVERVSGMPLSEFARREIFDPLGMTATRYVDNAATLIKNRATNYERLADGTFELSKEEWGDNTFGTSERFPDGGTGVISTVEDFVKWDRNFSEAAVGGRDLLEAMKTPGLLNTGESTDYGSGLAMGSYKGLRTVGHTGLGHGNSSVYTRFPDQHVSVICFCNSNTNPIRLVNGVSDIYLTDELRQAAPPPKTIQLSAEQLKKFSGTYRSVSDGAIVRVQVREGGLGMIFTLFGEQEQLHQATSENEFGEIRFQGTRMLDPSTHEAWEKVDLVSPTAAALGEYTGEWYSPDIDTRYQITLEGGHLRWSYPLNKSGYSLTPSVRDQFRYSATNFEFTRGGSGKIVALTVMLPRARNIRFTRIGVRK